jgi:two-component system cell cycle response regulator
MTGRVLVVDDIPINQRLLAARLSAEYYEVQCAGSGAEALEMMAVEHPDVVLLDVMMPGMTGFECCEKIKENPEFGHVPVVMVTALDSLEDRIRGLEAGADEFLSKPVNDIALLTRVRALTRLKRILDELKLREATDDEFGIRDSIAEISGDGGVWIALDLPGGDFDALEEAATICGSQLRTERDPEALITALVAGEAELAVIEVSGLVDGLRLCSRLRARTETRSVPILLVGDSWETDSLYKGLELGASDYASRPIDHAELVARIRLQIKRYRFHEQLRDQHRVNRAMATRDPLTGAFNRRYFNDHFERLIKHAAENRQPIALILADIDHFKTVNDSYGHLAGDAVLQEFMRRIGVQTRATDMVARFGGEEFAIVTPDANLEVAGRVAERLRASIADAKFELDDGTSIAMSCSFGVAMVCDGDTLADVLARSDAALYEAKSGGRNRVIAAATAVDADARSA